MGARSPVTLPEHPALRPQRRVLLLFGMLAAGVALLSIPAREPLLAVVGGGLAALFGRLLWVLPRRIRDVQLHNTALQRILDGKEHEAEELLAQLHPSSLRRGPVARGAQSQLAVIAFHRGEVERAVALASAAIAQPFARLRLARSNEEMFRAKALALRALANASLGQVALAEADALAAETAPSATPDVLARASLSRSVILARNKDQPALAAHLAAHAGLMLEWLTPRERTLVRALRRMARAPAKSIYRESARPDDETEEAKLASWIGKLAPGAEAFVRETAGRAAAFEPVGPAATATKEALESVARSRKDAAKPIRTRQRRLVLGLWVALIAMFFVVYQALSLAPARGRAHAPVVDDGTWWTLLPAVFGAVLAVLLGRQLYLRQSQLRALAAAQLDVARGELARARSTFERLAESRLESVAATAGLALASLSERRGAWSEVMDHVERASARLSRTAALRAVHSDLLVPELLATRALALAASDRADEANAERALLATDFPGFVLMQRAELRVRLVLAVRRGDLEEARRIAGTRTPDMPLTIRDEMLADLVLAATTAVPADERDRIDGELHDDPELRAWIDGIAPGLRERSRTRVAVAAPAAEGAPEELEAAGEEPVLRRASL